MKTLVNDKYGLTKKVVLFQLLYHCELMYDYLTETGGDVSEDTGNVLSAINLKTSELINNYASQKVKGRLDESTELKLQTEIAKVLESDKESLTKIFNTLKKQCKPASPCTLENTIPTHKIFFWFGSRVTLFMRTLWLLSIIFLLGYVIFGCLSVPNFAIALTEKFWLLFFQQLLLLFSGGLGACLFALITTKRYFIKRTFDNKYISYYYNRIVIGIITGFILANIIDPSAINDLLNAKPQDQAALNATKNIILILTPSLLALLGGFSADAVIKILNRLVSMIITLVEGDTKDIIDSREQEIKNTMEAKKIKQNMDYAVELKSGLDASDLDKDSDLYKKINSTITKLMEGNS